MKPKQLLQLVIVAAVLGGVAFLTSRSPQEKTPNRTGELLLKDVNIDDITRIELSGDQGETTLVLDNDSWVVQQKHGIPANFERLRRAMISLSTLKIDHSIAATESQKADMNITDSSSRVKFFAANGELLNELILGDARESEAQPNSPYGSFPNGRFVSNDGGQSVVVVSNPLQAFTESAPKMWMDSELFSVNGDALTSVTVTGPGRDTIELTRKGEDDTLTLTLQDGEAVDESKLTSLSSALGYMRFNDVADPTLTEEQLGMDAPIVFEAKTQNGSFYSVTIGGTVLSGEDRYARCRVAYIGNNTANDEANEQDEAEKRQQEDEVQDVKSALTELQAKLAPWTYVIPAYKANALIAERNTYLKETVTEDPVPENAPPTAAPQLEAKTETKSGDELPSTADK